MIDDVVFALRHATTKRERMQILFDAERTLTPLEVDLLTKRAHNLPPLVRRRLAELTGHMGRGHPAARRFVRQKLHGGIDRYSNPTVPASRKRLIIAFAGFQGRLLMPPAIMLQYLPEDSFDLVILNDGSRSHFMNGIEAYASSLHDLVRRLSVELGQQDYERTFCYGTSGGGLAALRCAILLEADRGIAVGGRFQWHIHRLRDEHEREIPAFDVLCHCNADTRVELVCAFGADNETDRIAATQVAAILPVEQIAFRGIAIHNSIYSLLVERKLGDFFSRIFEIKIQAGTVNELTAEILRSIGGLSAPGIRPRS